jgi:2-oxoisovalerate dehydrogenase E1 component
MGLSINGYKAIVEMQFADFVSTGFNPIVNLLAKSHYRWLENADVVVRMPCGGGTQAGPFIPRPMKLGLLKHLAKSGISCFSL